MIFFFGAGGEIKASVYYYYTNNYNPKISEILDFLYKHYISKKKKLIFINKIHKKLVLHYGEIIVSIIISTHMYHIITKLDFCRRKNNCYD